MDRLTAQQASLVRSVALVDPGYLDRSFYLDPRTGKRIAHELEPAELADFLTSWAIAPLESIRSMNGAISRLPESTRKERYVRAAVDLEILMDQQSWAEDGRVYRGIPDYLMHGYTDMGTHASPTERSGREKIKVDKVRMAGRLTECKRRGVVGNREVDPLLAWYYNCVRQDIEFNELGVEKLSRDFGNESIVLSEYLEKGLGVCRHLSIFFQLYLQEGGFDCRVVKGNLKFYIFKGRHAWNLVTFDGRVSLVDVTHPNGDQPFIVSGATEEEVYERAAEHSRTYEATPDEQNFYKIGNA
ncbi:MAG: transglutaminase domain-containing protein [Vicinamibacteria bacterium]